MVFSVAYLSSTQLNSKELIWLFAYQVFLDGMFSEDKKNTYQLKIG
jgi:hypothetical protein